MSTYPLWLVDEFGQPLSARLQRTLATLAARLQRAYPALQDHCAVTEILEEAGRRLAAIEERKGPIASLDVYAWTVVRRMAALRQRLDGWAVSSARLPAEASRTAVDQLAATVGTPAQMEATIFCAELAALLTAEERHLLKAKQGGLSMEEIGALQGMSRVTVARAWRRLKRKVQSLVTPTRRSGTPIPLDARAPRHGLRVSARRGRAGSPRR